MGKLKLLFFSVFVLLFASCGRVEQQKEEPATVKKEDKPSVADPSADSVVNSEKHPFLLAYPDHIDSIANGTIYWKDKTIMPLSKSKETKTDLSKLSKTGYEEYLNKISPAQMLDVDYPYLAPVTPPAKNHDPGRGRNTDFLKKVYGANEHEVSRRLQQVVWLRKNVNMIVSVNGENGAAASLQKISDELDKLPSKFMKYLINPAGTFVWRPIAGTKRLSAHSFGISIDINVSHSNYWRYRRPDKSGLYKFENSIPFEIVEIFERNGWIWGGRWYHYDTMHFEYRPELIIAALQNKKGKTAIVTDQKKNPLKKK